MSELVITAEAPLTRREGQNGRTGPFTTRELSLLAGDAEVELFLRQIAIIICIPLVFSPDLAEPGAELLFADRSVAIFVHSDAA